VTIHSLELLGVDGDLVRLRVECSAGFYVRALAQDLGVSLGTGGHLAGLRRTRSGSALIEVAVPLDDLDRRPELAREHLIPMSAMLSDFPVLVLSEAGVRHAVQGRVLTARDFADGVPPGPPAGGHEGLPPVRLLTPSGELLALATWQAAHRASPVLHPSVVLG
jgi:tRNA pseudouridine55 synthase